jgi:response regulator RpfG family c-di-GMP phosphodiesterase
MVELGELDRLRGTARGAGAAPDAPELNGASYGPWRVVIADRDGDLCTRGRLALRELSFEHRPVELMEARSAEEACRIVRDNLDAAVLLVDADLDRPAGGLPVVDYVRRTLSNAMVRIIYCAEADNPEEEARVASDFDINDYYAKGDLSAEKLRATVTLALRNYSDLESIIGLRLRHRQLLGQKESLEQRVWERTEELRDTRLEIIHRLGEAAEHRDNETGNHIFRVSHTCAAVARAMGWDEEEVELVLHVTPMHDVGKIGIPDRALLKNGGLTDEEWVIMRSHCQIGAEILGGSRSQMLQAAAEVAFAHHEKWNGKGYPRGLVGEEIPIMARVCAVADVFDALGSERPYKEAWPLDEAVAEIRRSSGSHFDPSLVDVFIDILPEILGIRSRFAD